MVMCGGDVNPFYYKSRNRDYCERLLFNKISDEKFHYILKAMIEVDNWLENQEFLSPSIKRLDLNVLNYAGRNLLMICCEKVNDEIFDLLISHPQVDVNVRSHNGWTPLMILAKYH